MASSGFRKRSGGNDQSCFEGEGRDRVPSTVCSDTDPVNSEEYEFTGKRVNRRAYANCALRTLTFLPSGERIEGMKRIGQQFALYIRARARCGPV